MMMNEQLVAGLFETTTDAQHVIEHLVREGFSRDDISLVANDTTTEYGKYFNRAEGTDVYDVKADEGAGFGAVVGALTGILAGLAAFAIPGIGPVLAAGPLAAALTGGAVGAATGAVTGGLVAALVKTGVPETDAQFYVEGVRRGSALVTVHSSAAKAPLARDIMDRHNPINVAQRRDEWQRSGWTGFDANAKPYTAQELATFRSSPPSTAMVRGFDRYADDFRTHYITHYGTRGYTYERYSPAYQFGYELANNADYLGKDWMAIEQDARMRWEARHQGAWEDFKDAIRYAWDKLRGAYPASTAR